MLKRIFSTLEQALSPALAGRDTASSSIERDLELAAAALLVEMTRADDHVQAVEEASVIDAVRDAFGLDEAQAAALHERAVDRADEAVSLYEFTRLLNDRLDDARKQHLVELLWRVAAADGDIDRYEEHLVRKIADLLYVPHARFIQAKLRVLEGAPGSR